MIKVYGIKTCGSVKKAINYLEENGIEFEFIDFKKQKPSKEELESWLKYISLKVLLNNKGMTYKKLGLSKLSLSDEEIFNYLLQEPLLIKRPVIATKDSVIVGFDEEIYKNTKWH
ncbi:MULTISPECIES: arsenate reductase family protein [Helicobacter]|uniref:Arsenate reductase family protein n=1 Tax=Helicobacter ibis TaxID=2962633 RepID=A0ABT4VDH9_9HELI|nr:MULTISPECIES: arsenate reductase family protein [Helicobacter]MDA3966618.1 arsenate reductase family protein [Helicobacter sp. WB40]MDA3968767.1 arsenate reductase family protein [Helicobacter ibis]